MFTGTLRFNLDPENKVEDHKMIQLMIQAGLTHLLDQGGLDQLITEGGANMSSGEKQLVCICRAIVRKS